MNKRRRLRVLQIGKFYPPDRGGMESHLKDLCDELYKHVDLEVLVSNSGRQTKEDTVEGIPVTRLGTQIKLAATCFSSEMVGRIAASKADLVHVHLPNPAAVMAYLASRSRARVICTYHSDVVRQRVLGALFDPLLHRFLRRCSAILVASPNYARSSPTLVRHPERCHIVPFGIAPQPRAEAIEAAEIRRLYGDRLVLGVGRLVYYKGFEYLIRAMGQINGHLCLVGTGPLRQELEQVAQQLGVADRITFMGEVSNETLAALYQAADVFVLPSIARSEAFGLVQVEAMAAGKPVVNTSLDSGVPFVSLDGVTGLTVPPKNSEALAGAVNRLLDDDAMRRQYSIAALQRAREEFSRSKMLERVLSVYEGAMLQPKGAPVSPAITAGVTPPTLVDR